MHRLIGGATVALLALAVVAGPALAGNPGSRHGSSTIVEIVLADDGEFDVLQAAAVEAGLVGASAAATSTRSSPPRTRHS